MVSRLYKSCESISRLALLMGGIMVGFSVLLVTIEVISRKVFSTSVIGSDEISGYILACATAWGLSYALYRRRHIRVDAVYVHLPAAVQRTLDIIALVALGSFFSILAYQAVFVFAESWRIGAESNTTLRIPLWIPQFIWMLGLVFFVFNIFVILCEVLMALFRRDFALMKSIAAAPSIREEIDDEIGETNAPAEKARAEGAAA